ncbi:hypothetical protein [Marinivivus vitaminiproducens]|uniref:hypothetical protein n=1 Tax=Marinivivus vitaminiproducens TaxID=3035935 RepID=UPI0027A72CB6|nr:hypothetical protein P4R82_04895 [Geminicoccaceae bacterium SCSIO 64248]
MALSPLALCSAALVKIGALPLASLGDGSAEATVASQLYPLVRDSLLAAHPWTFALRQVRPERLAQAPEADFRHAFALPADFLAALSVGTGTRGRNVTYRVAAGAVHTDAEAIVLTYVSRPEEAAFPPLFDHVLVAALAAEFCVPLTENTSRADVLGRQAKEALRDAKRIDSQQDTPGAIEDFTLIRARRG